MAQTNIFATRTGMGTIPGRATCMLSSGKASKEIHELAQAPFVRQWTVVPVRVPACVGSLFIVYCLLFRPEAEHTGRQFSIQ